MSGMWQNYATSENNLSTGSRRISFLTSGQHSPHPLSWAGPASCRGGGHNHTATPPPKPKQRDCAQPRTPNSKNTSSRHRLRAGKQNGSRLFWAPSTHSWVQPPTSHAWAPKCLRRLSKASKVPPPIGAICSGPQICVGMSNLPR